MKDDLAPTLAPPGAGLPRIELFVGNILLRIRLATGDRGSFNARFNKERQAIRALVESCRGETGGKRVSIERPPGLEDSSRYWSVWMTLDHLRIVHHEIAKAIAQLGNGVVPSQKVSTATVKPSPEASEAVVAAYEASCDAVMAAVAALPDLHTSARLSHPWFGPLDAYGWHGLMGGHMGIHRGQIERILQKLARQSTR